MFLSLFFLYFSISFFVWYVMLSLSLLLCFSFLFLLFIMGFNSKRSGKDIQTGETFFALLVYFSGYIWYTNNICVFYFNVDNIWVNGEAIDELWSWWMDWVTKEGVCTCNWRLLHCCFASLLRHLPQSHQSTMFLLIMWHLFVFIFYLFIKALYLVFEEIDERKKSKIFLFQSSYSLYKKDTQNKQKTWLIFVFKIYVVTNNNG